MQVGINQSPQRYFHSNKFQTNFQKSPNYFIPNNQFRQPQHTNQGGQGNVEFDGKRLRKAVSRKTVDYNTVIVKYLEARAWQRDVRDRRAVQPDVGYYTEILPPMSMPENPVNAITTKFVRTSTNKMRCPIFCVAWTPEGRRLITGASSGEFTLWNGLTFNFETILQAHDSPVRCMVWSHNDTWMVTGDHSGYVKYWQSNMNNVKMFQAHKEPLRGISFCPTDTKFVTCSDDGTVRIWDFLRCTEEKILRGHGADVKCVAWHPQKSLIVSGSKDSQQPIKLWDPKSGTSLATIHAHKSTVMEVKWNQNGNWMLTASRDHLLKLFDIRNLSQDIQTFRGHKKEACSISWHPIHESMFVSGGSDGSVMFWVVGAEKEVGGMEQAHDSCVWSLAWHPLGHILCTGSNDHTSKFWTRNRPGDRMRDKYNLNTLPKGLDDTNEYDDVSTGCLIIPGMGLEMGQIPPDGSLSLAALEGHPLGNLHTSPQLLRPNLLPEGGTVAGIPGLDFNDELLQAEKQEQQQAQRKVPFSKPIPRQFQQSWMENKQPLLLAPPLVNQSKDDNKMLPPPPPGGPEQQHLLPGPPNMMGPPNQGVPPNSIGGPSTLIGGPMGVPPNHMGGPPNHMGGPPNQMGMGGPPNQMGGLLNQMGGPPNQMGGPPNQMGGPSNQMGGLPNQMGGPPNQMGGPPNQMGRPNQMDGPQNQMSGPPNQMGGPPNQMGGPPNQMDGPSNQMGRPPNQMDGPINQMGRPNQMGGPSNQMGGPNQIGGSGQMGDSNQMGMPPPPNQMRGGQPFGPRSRTTFSTSHPMQPFPPDHPQAGPPNNQRGPPPNQMQGQPHFGPRGNRTTFVTSHPMQQFPQDHQQGGPPNNQRGPLLQHPGGYGGGGPPSGGGGETEFHQQRGDFDDGSFWSTRDIVPHGNDQQPPPFHNNNNQQQQQQERWFQMRRTKNNY